MQGAIDRARARSRLGARPSRAGLGLFLYAGSLNGSECLQMKNVVSKCTLRFSIRLPPGPMLKSFIRP